MSHFRYFVRLSYDGTNYHGWQYQKNAQSIQPMLEKAFTVILKKEVKLTGCGRTDAGVHAKEFYAHFDLSLPQDTKARNKLIFNLNGYLPRDLAIQAILPVNPSANARFSAISRTYRYVITRVKDPFLYGYSYFFKGIIDIELMNRGAEMLLECHDFTSFAKVDAQTKTNLCRILEARWERTGDQLNFTIKADRFLRNMVRAITGTLLELGRGKIGLRELERVIDGKSRSLAGDSVPACGLYLVKIEYPEDIFI